MAEVSDVLTFAGTCVGVKHHNRKVVDAMTSDENHAAHLTLVPEPTNPHDPRAVAVCYKTRPVGHVCADYVEDAHAFLAEAEKEGGKMVWEVTKAKLSNDVLQWFEFEIKVMHES